MAVRQKATSLKWGKHQISPLGIVGRQANSGTEACIICRCASQTDNGGLCPAFKKELILIIP